MTPEDYRQLLRDISRWLAEDDSKVSAMRVRSIIAATLRG